jgi:hypothetical protein
MGHSVEARFTVLNVAHSNRCDLGAGELRNMPGRMHLQGSCCFPMDQAHYAQQLRGLRHHADVRLLPSDPYDVSVTVAKRLLGYRQIRLSHGEKVLYRRASAKSSLGGPCCCHCWRWQAFKGQARFMIARRHYSATRVARLWELEEGCGGPEET